MKKKVFAVLTAALIATGAFGCTDSNKSSNDPINSAGEIANNQTKQTPRVEF